jgi:glyoxylase-like metal-dependent hydrolase (beta-lactamase superfamily II)
MVEQVTESLFRIACRRSNAYLFAGDRLTLIDSGMPEDSVRISAAVEKVGYNPSEIAYIVLTHGHLDHAGSAARIREVSGARVAAGAADADYIEGRRMLCSMPREGAGGMLFRLVLFFLERYIQRYCPVSVDIKHSPGQDCDIANLALIAAPGHSPGSIAVYHAQEKVLIVGDALSGAPKPHLPLRQGCADYAEALRSAERLAELNFSICLFGHGPPLSTGAAERIRDLVRTAPLST